MAGRGTDIILGGNIQFKIQKELYAILTLTKNLWKDQKKINIFRIFNQINNSSQKFISVLLSLSRDNQFLALSDTDILRILRENDRIVTPTISYQCSVKVLVNELILFNKKHQTQDQKIVKNLGGLYIVGTERNDSQRVDNQLRGRCARQGDPGTSRFFLSLDDTLLRLFGGPNIQNFIQTQLFDDSPLESKLITKSLNRAQKRVEERAYEQRKNLFEYDDVLNKQRETIYFERRKILESRSIRNKILEYSEQTIAENAPVTLSKRKKILNFFSTLLSKFISIFVYGKNFKLLKPSSNNIKLKTLKPHLFSEIWMDYYIKDFELYPYQNDCIETEERDTILFFNDLIWKEHLQRMTLLREAVGWRGYGQRNPLYEYRQDAYGLFQEFQAILRQVILDNLKRSSIL
jgi:preprotein translocase subunit SecA